MGNRSLSFQMYTFSITIQSYCRPGEDPWIFDIIIITYLQPSKHEKHPIQWDHIPRDRFM